MCWRLDLRIDSRRSIPLSEMLPNSFAGLQRRKASTPEGRRSLARSPQARELTFGGPKDAVAHPEAQARRERPSKEPERSPSDAMVTVDHSGPRRPKVVKHQDETRRRTRRPSSGVGVHVKHEYVRRSDLYTSHLVVLPQNRL